MAVVDEEEERKGDGRRKKERGRGRERAADWALIDGGHCWLSLKKSLRKGQTVTGEEETEKESSLSLTFPDWASVARPNHFLFRFFFSSG